MSVASGATLDLNNNSVTIAGLNDVAGVGGTVTNSGASLQTLSLGGSGTYSFGGAISGANTALTVALTGGGTQTLAGANNYSGGTTLSSGTLQLSGAGTLGATTAALTLNGGTLDLNSTSQQVGNFSGSGGVVLNSGSGTSVLTIGSGNASGGNFAGVIENNAGSGGSVGLTKIGTGTLTLSGANTYSGPTTVSGGTLQAGVASVAGVRGALGLNSAVTLANTAGTTLNLNNFSTQIGSLSGGGATGGNVTLGSATLTDVQTTPTSFAGMISGSGGLTLNGPGGTLTLSGANTYSGVTTVTAGTLQLANPGSLGATAVMVGNGSSGHGTLLINGNSTIGTGAGGSLTLSGGTNTTGQGTLTFSSSESTPVTLALLNNTAGATVLTIGGAVESGDPELQPRHQRCRQDRGDSRRGGRGRGRSRQYQRLEQHTVTPGTYALILDAGLSSGSYTSLTLGTISGYSGTDVFSLSQTGSGANATAENLVVQSAAATPAAAYYWSGAHGSVWNTTSPGTNWVNGPTGTDTGSIPTSTVNVFETANAASNLSQTLAPTSPSTA